MYLLHVPIAVLIKDRFPTIFIPARTVYFSKWQKSHLELGSFHNKYLKLLLFQKTVVNDPYALPSFHPKSLSPLYQMELMDLLS